MSMFKKPKKERVQEYKQKRKLKQEYKEKKKKATVEERLEIIEELLDIK